MGSVGFKSHLCHQQLSRYSPFSLLDSIHRKATEPARASLDDDNVPKLDLLLKLLKEAIDAPSNAYIKRFGVSMSELALWNTRTPYVINNTLSSFDEVLFTSIFDSLARMNMYHIESLNDVLAALIKMKLSVSKKSVSTIMIANNADMITAMGLKKKREQYFICYDNGTKVCVTEELYRIWAYYTNKEYHASRQYSPRLVHIGAEEYVAPSRLVSFEDFILSDSCEQFRYSPTIKYDRDTLAYLLIRCIKALPEKQGRVIVLIFFEGLPETRIAKLLHMAQSSVSNYKARALMTLRKLLIAEGYSKEDLFNMLHR